MQNHLDRVPYIERDPRKKEIYFSYGTYGTAPLLVVCIYPKGKCRHRLRAIPYHICTKAYHRLDDLLIQYDNYCALENKPNKSLGEKMKLQLAKQSLSRHGIKTPEDARELELQKQEYDERIAELKEKIQTNTNLLSAFKEISDTYNGISKGDYITNLMKSEQEIEAERRASSQDRSVPKHDTPAPKPTVQDVAPKPEQQESEPEKSEPKPDESAQKPKTTTTSRGLKH